MMIPCQDITEPEAIHVGDLVVVETMEGNLHWYTVASVTFGMRYEHDETPRVVVTYDQHKGSHCFPTGGAKVTAVDGVIGVCRLPKQRIGELHAPVASRRADA